jgi:hypothetical protein
VSRLAAGADQTTASLSDLTRSNMPYFEQLFVTANGAPVMGIALDRLTYCLRRRTSARDRGCTSRRCQPGRWSTRGC